MVKDMEESLKFYGDVLGLKVSSVLNGGPGTQIAFLGDGDTSIELICDQKHNKITIGDDISWGFQVESLDQTLAAVKKKGIAIDSGPFNPSLKTKFFFIRDPNGLKIQFVEHLD